MGERDKTPGIDIRTGMDVDAFREDIKQHLYYTLAKDDHSSTEWDRYRSVVLSVMDRLHHRWIQTQQGYYRDEVKRVYYLSMEYLIGRLLDNMLVNLGLQEAAAEALEELGLDYDKIREAEVDAGLGNGGLGRLAACYLDSMATLGISAIGYGIRYDFGIFDQVIEDGWQVEKPDMWLEYGYPWGIVRPKIQYDISFYGEAVSYQEEQERLVFGWENTHNVKALAFDTPIPGYKNDVVNHLRLWRASSGHTIDLESFNQGEYVEAVRQNLMEENISKVLYPNDKMPSGQELRLKQEYFLVSSSLQDIIRRFKKQYEDFQKLPEKVAIQCNDTHPVLAIPELMRILMDEEGLKWATGWEITRSTVNFTNHTLMPEALEKWPVSLLGNLLPRHMQIIREINRRFLEHIDVKDPEREKRMRVISDEMNPVVRMGNLGIIGSNKVNGVSKVHAELLQKTSFRDFYELDPEKFTYVTNGITPRRWLRQCNRGLSHLVTRHLGDDWLTDLNQLKELEPLAEDTAFVNRFAEIKLQNKKKLAAYVSETLDVEINPHSMFDIQVKRIHEYKRQLLAAMHAAALYNRIKQNPGLDIPPRTILFAGKAAPGYAMAKLHIKFITSVARIINNDSDVKEKLRCVFLPNYSVSLAEKMIPAANLSEQIATAGMEASGTGNMKFALNGALTIGTMDGANVEMLERVGEENMFIFGLTVEEIERVKSEGYQPENHYREQPALRKVVEQMRDGFFSRDEPDLFQPIVNVLLNQGDPFMIMADFESYLETQQRAEELFKDEYEWNRKAVINMANMGYFTSDRSVREYARKIWDVD